MTRCGENQQTRIRLTPLHTFIFLPGLTGRSLDPGNWFYFSVRGQTGATTGREGGWDTELGWWVQQSGQREGNSVVVNKETGSLMVDIADPAGCEMVRLDSVRPDSNYRHLDQRT